MFSRYLPMIYGLLVVIAFISAMTIVYRLLGFDKGEALYFACLTLALFAYALSRRLIHPLKGK